MKIAIFEYEKIYPLQKLGLTGDFWIMHIDTLVYTWYAMLVLLIVALIGRFFLLKREHSTVALAYEKLIGFFMNLCTESFNSFNLNYFIFVTSLFFFTLFCCLIGLIPFLDESTKDLNTTFALGLTSFMYVQYQKIKVHGLMGYLSEFAQPFFLLAPINLVGELAKIASMSFRLFGNILGGSIIFTMLIQLVDIYKVYFLSYVAITLLLALLLEKVPFITRYSGVTKVVRATIFIMFLLTWAQMFFGIFHGLIQSFVITMLTVTYFAMGTVSEESHQTALPPQQEDNLEGAL